jgi:LuxR family transcriptional regulator, maltose regulon positive regulatory protein
VGTVGRRGRFEPLTGSRRALLRPRLVDRLRGRFTLPVVVLIAPAGFGKTTLLAQAVDENRVASPATPAIDRWLTCRPADAAASTLAEGLYEAVGLDTGPRDATAAVDAIAEAMWHRSPQDVALLLDDVHEIPPDSPGAELLSLLVAALPRNGHLVLAGRVAPPVTLARLEVQGHTFRLEEADLAFTDDELAAFAADRRVPAERLARCGGWPALTELAASTGAETEAAYLWEEVLAGIPPDRRRDLALLAHVGAVDDRLAAAALDREVDLAALTGGLPLVGQGPGGAWSIHPLWQPFLAGEVTAADVAAARRRAGLTLALGGDVAAAVPLLAEASAWDDLTAVVTDALGAAQPPVPGDVVAGWLGRLPPEMAASPLARLLAAVGGTDVTSLTEAGDAFRQEGNLSGELACMAQLAQMAWWWEQPEQMLAVATRVIELEAAGYAPAVPLARLARALVADVANDCATALAELDRIPPGSFNQTWQSLVDWLRSTSLHHLGRPGEALAAAERACAHPGPLHAPLIESARLQALWFQGHVDQVLRQLPPLVDRTAATGLRNYTSLMAASCCMALALAGRASDAAPFLERARRTASSRDVPLVDVNLAIAEAALAVTQGDEAAAAAVLDAYLDRSPLLGTGHAAAPQQRTLALWYVLVPGSRPVWDAASLGPCFAQARTLAQALVALRSSTAPRAAPRLDPRAVPAASSGGPPPADLAAALADPGLVRAHLPLRWATELALARIDAGDHAGWRLLDALWPAAQSEVRRHAATRATPRRAARRALARLPVPPEGRLDLRLLGPVELRRDGVPVDTPEWHRERVRSLLAHLALHGRASRARLAADLWPELDADAQSRNLRVTLTHLLRVLEPARRERDASFLVRPHGGSLVLHAGDHFDTDVWRFDALWHQAAEAERRGAPSAGLAAMQQAVGLWRDDPSELAGEPWAIPEIEERGLRLVTLATRAGELLLAQGEPHEARRMARAALRADPWSEPAHRMLVRAHLARGDAPGARRALARYRHVLQELGTSPEERTELVAPLARQLDHLPHPRRPSR